MKIGSKLLVGLLLINFATTGSVQAEALTLGLVLDSLAGRLETVVRTGGEAGRGVVVQAGTEAYMAVQATKVAYDDSLNKSVELVDAMTTSKLQELESIVNQLEKGTDAQIATISSQAQQVVNTLPFASNMPQVTSFSPRFVAWNPQPRKIEIAIKGNFMFAHKPNFQPELLIPGQKSYRLQQNTTQSLVFVASPQLREARNQILPMSIRLLVPYQEGKIFPQHKVATYDLLMGIMPQSPGRIMLNKKSIVSWNEKYHYVTQGWSQHSSDDDLKDILYEGPDHPKCRIVDNSVKFVTDWTQGDENDDWSKVKVRSNPSVAFKVTTIHRVFGTSGKVDFHFEYDYECPKTKEVWQPETVNLTWGQSKLFPVETNNWRASFDTFDGQHLEFSGPIAHRFLEAKVQGKNLILSMPVASEIRY